MRRLLFVKTIITIMFIGGCQTSSQRDVVEFPVSRNIAFNEVSIPDVLAIPGEIIIHKEMVIVLDLGTDWFFKCFTLSDLTYLGSLVRRGRGPEEEIEISPFFRTYGNDAILYQGANSVKIATVDFSHNSLEHEVIEEYELPARMNNDTDFFLLNRNLYSSISFLYATSDFRGYCPETGQFFEWGEQLPLKSAGGYDSNMRMTLEKITTVKPDEQYLATVYGKLPIIRIYIVESGKLLSEMKMADFSNNERILFDKSSDYVRDGLLYYYFRIKSTTDYIYALYSGQPVVNTSFEGGRPLYTDNASEIHIWKWDGTPVMKLNLNRPVFSFDVTPDNKRIIAFSIVDVDRFFQAEIPWD